MKTNITLKIDSDLLREAKIFAAETGSSISGLLSSKLEEIVRSRRGYERARSRALKRLETGFDLGSKRPRHREELHER